MVPPLGMFQPFLLHIPGHHLLLCVVKGKNRCFQDLMIRHWLWYTLFNFCFNHGFEIWDFVYNSFNNLVLLILYCCNSLPIQTSCRGTHIYTFEWQALTYQVICVQYSLLNFGKSLFIGLFIIFKLIFKFPIHIHCCYLMAGLMILIDNDLIIFFIVKLLNLEFEFICRSSHLVDIFQKFINFGPWIKFFIFRIIIDFWL